MPTPTEIVAACCAAFADNEGETAIQRWFTPETVWVNEGFSITTGIEEALSRRRSPGVAVHFDMLAIAADGNRVLTERLDRFVRPDGSEVAALKVMGIFEIVDGHIVAWREYFDVEAARRMSSNRE